MPRPTFSWRFEDPYDPNPLTNRYTFKISPNEMSSPLPTRQLTAMTTTGVNGQTLLFEGNAGAKEWSFSGTLLERAQYETLRSWVYNRKRRIVVVDHYGRRILCVLRDFEATPARSINHFWRHQWTINALVVSVTAPTVGDVW